MIPTRRSFLAALGTAPLLLHAATGPVAAATSPRVFSAAGLALRGSDPVAYFTEQRPRAGLEAHRAEWDGFTWHFADAANRDRFAADPARYAPVFGGYCAYAASKGYLAPTIPEAWTVHEGRLYLNASLRARELWVQDIPGNIVKGRANWPAILG